MGNGIRWIVVVVALAAFGASCDAALVLDQANTTLGSSSTFEGFGFPSGITRAQTFTVGVAGSLEQIDVILNKQFDKGATVTLDIRNVVGGFPSTVLASTSLPTDSLSTSPAWVSFDIPGLNVGIGDLLAVSIRESVFNTITIGRSVGNAYPFGSPFTFNLLDTGQWLQDGAQGVAADLNFRTFVEPVAAVGVPEPTSVALITLMLGPLARRQRRLSK